MSFVCRNSKKVFANCSFLVALSFKCQYVIITESTVQNQYQLEAGRDMTSNYDTLNVLFVFNFALIDRL